MEVILVKHFFWIYYGLLILNHIKYFHIVHKFSQEIMKSCLSVLQNQCWMNVVWAVSFGIYALRILYVLDISHHVRCQVHNVLVILCIHWTLLLSMVHSSRCREQDDFIMAQLWWYWRKLEGKFLFCNIFKPHDHFARDKSVKRGQLFSVLFQHSSSSNIH